ncbi:F-box/WD repeat-containing protein 7-like isoform X1 [Dreissena polymorpha]|uniref:F-box/WD repeat-containing protein 7-like isoform X1 n=1 Tax=Dreissena polymorpha TaxID=45954 RepID=UPI0022647F3E|nr:F-box/WD repeat-containing protein 7-like isoform X1 [Dreissena polymorpha]XP_052281444.1 F-box/WD repeat-containing protein 7-like isoform X1 [Dreissena polymorpha]
MGTKRLDINTATVSEFEQLIGVGHLKAEAIIKQRKVLGGFQSVSDLGEVPGVGQSVIDLNRSQLCCNTSRRASRAIRVRNASQSSNGSPTRKCGSSRLRLKQLSVFKRSKSTPQAGKAKRLKVYSKQICENGVKIFRSRERILPKDSDKSEKLLISAKSVYDDGPSTSSSSNNSAADCCKALHESHRTLNECLSNQEDNYGEEELEMQEGEEEEEEERESIQGDVNSIRNDIERGDNTEEESNTSDVSDSVYSLLKRKELHNRLYPSGKRLLHSKLSSPQTTYGNLKRPLKRSGHPLHRQRIPSKEHPPPGLAEWLKQFQDWGNAERLMAVDELIHLCEPTQVRHMMQVIEPQFQRDFISLLPKELALYVLSFLEPKSLLQAAQTCRYWRVLAEDNLLWREKCREESIDEPLVFGSNSRLRRRQPSPKSPWKSLYMRQHQIEQNWRTGPLRLPKLLKGHDDHVITCLEFCGYRVVSGSDDNTLKVWSALTGKCLRTLVGHTGGVWSSQMQGNVIISGSTDRTLKVWNADTGVCTHTLYGHTSTVRCMHLCGNKVVSGSRDATLRVWNVETGQCLHVLMGHVAAVRCVQYDGRRVVSGAYDYMVKVWDPETETCLHTLQGHTNRVYSLQFDGVHIVSGSLDTSIRVWDVENGQCLHTLVGHQSLTSGLELKDNILVSGNADSTVKVWDITTGQCLQTLQGSNKHQSAVTCLQFNKKFVITSSDDGTVKIWDLKSGEFLRNLVTLESGGSGGVVWRVRCSNTKLVCAVGSRNGTEETKLLVLDFDVEEKKDKMPIIERV